MGVMRSDFEDMKRSRDESKKQLNDKFEDVAL
jgi:hypothetical protein